MIYGTLHKTLSSVKKTPGQFSLIIHHATQPAQTCTVQTVMVLGGVSVK